MALNLAFAGATDIALPPGSPTGIAMADFTGDGKVDLAVSYRSGDLQFLRGNGDGSFSMPATFSSLGQGTEYISAADLDQDGRADVVTANRDSMNVSILYGTLAGFGVSTLIATSDGQAPGGIAIGDIDGDGWVDIAVSPGTLLFGSGRGRFQGPMQSNLTFGATLPLLTADFNLDGRTDLLSDSALLWASANRTLASGWQNPDNWDNVHSRAVGDLNGDGRPDLVCTSFLSLFVYPADNKGSLGPVTVLPTAAVPYPVGIADFNLDAWEDVAVWADNNELQVFVGDRTGKLKPQPFRLPVGMNGDQLPPGVGLTTVDMNQDGKPDVGVLFYKPPRVTIILNASK